MSMWYIVGCLAGRGNVWAYVCEVIAPEISGYDFKVCKF